MIDPPAYLRAGKDSHVAAALEGTTAEKGYYRLHTIYSISLRAVAPVAYTVYVFESDQFGGWMTQFVNYFNSGQNSLPVPLDTWRGSKYAEWKGPFTRAEIGRLPAP